MTVMYLGFKRATCIHRAAICIDVRLSDGLRVLAAYEYERRQAAAVADVYCSLCTARRME